ncbi:OLC1v1035455C1 [Oldenlandia corymbosa var. corymbosa]|uniref:OLC1v1035455C1 n=1 Tax=Oldenlandia corymbosa var. corymbosa TaxID=529605 RepID=A0AAV1CT33_OLDCO|nr:OLC1v1035455C1 [Oldenlandia corymbosa var. corymbosa]
MVFLRSVSHIVKPAEPTPEEVMYLSDCDQIKPLTHAPTIYFYRPSFYSSLEEIVPILKDSLSKVLVKFYPLAGRLHWTDGGRVELHCNSMGALLIEAESNLTIDDFGDFRPSPEIRSLIPSVDYNVTPIHEVPLLVAQVTKLKCGGIGFGAGMSHIVVDGQSAVHFVFEWSKIARGSPSDDHPFLDRRVLQQHDDLQLTLKPNLKYTDFFPLPLLLGKPDNLEERKKETKPMMLKLSKEQVESLRSKATLDLLNKGVEELRKIPAGGRPQVSRFDVVCAHIWKCLSLARGLQPEQETVLFVTVDFRNRINPPLPKRYFGNAVMPLPVSSTVNELLSNPVSYTARKIRTAIESVTDEYVRSYLRCIKSIPNIATKRHFHTVGCAQGSFFGNPNLIITSWVGLLPLYGAKFGWGDEVYLGPGSLGYDGRVFLIPSQDGDGSFIIPLRLQVEHADAFEKYFYEEIKSLDDK